MSIDGLLHEFKKSKFGISLLYFTLFFNIYI